MLKRLTALLLVLALLAGCVPPPRPAVGPNETDIPIAQRQVGILAAACPALDGSTGWEPGPFPEHGFPRIKASNGNYIMADASTTTLNRLRFYDMVEMVSSRPFWYENGCTANDTFAYLQAANPNIKLMGVFHSYGFNNPTAFSLTCHPTVRDKYDAYSTANGTGGDWHMLTDLGSYITWPGALSNQTILNWSDVQPDADHGSNSLGRWFGDYVSGANFEGKNWHGVILETVPVPSSLPGSAAADADENSLSDFYESGKGRAFFNAAQYAGWNYAWQRMADNGSALVTMTDGGWEPNPTGINDPPVMMPYANIAQDFSFPASSFYLNDCSASPSSSCPTRPPNNAWWAFHMRQYLTWMDGAGTEAAVPGASFVLAMTYYDEFANKTYAGATKWGTYVRSYDQYRRLVIGSALQDNGYAQVHAGQYPTWCDECGVVGGATTESLAAKNWMGCPLGVAVNESGQNMREVIASDWQALGTQVWKREFSNALVLVNPTTSARTVTIGSGWQRINGTYDRVHNNGAAVGTTLSVPAMDAYVLVRSGASTATPGATATNTPTGGATATPTVTPGGPTATSTPTSAPTNTPLPDRTPTAGAICGDWNLRGGCGPDDHFVELYVPAERSLTGWSISIGTCRYTFRADNWSSPFKVIFADEMVEPDGVTPCGGFPQSGFATLTDQTGAVRDVRSYTLSINGWSWQAVDATNPGGPWRHAPPNPGR
jgi:hypothetical protein